MKPSNNELKLTKPASARMDASFAAQLGVPADTRGGLGGGPR